MKPKLVTLIALTALWGSAAEATFANPVDPLTGDYPAGDFNSEIISQGSKSITGGMFSQGMAGSGPWAGEILSQGMRMSNGIVYSQGMQINLPVEGSSVPVLDDDAPVPPGIASTTSTNSVVGSDPAPSLVAITVPPGTVPPTTVPPSSALTTDGGNHPLTAPTSVGVTVETSGGIDPVTVSAAAQVPGPALGLAAGGSAASSNPIPEPGSLGLLGVALSWFGWASRRPPSQTPASHDISLTGTGQDQTGLA